MAAEPIVSVNVFCNDLDRVFDFYRLLLGLEEAVEQRSPIYRALRIGHSDLGFHAPAAVELLHAGGLRVDTPCVAHYPTFHVDSSERVDALVELALDLGGAVLKAPYLTYYNAWQAVLQDPERNFFRVNHYFAGAVAPATGGAPP